MLIDNFTSPDERNLASGSRLKKQFSMSTFRFESSNLTPIIHSSPLYFSNVLKKGKKLSFTSRLKDQPEENSKLTKPNPKSLKLNLFHASSASFPLSETHRPHSHFSSTLTSFTPITSRDFQVKGINVLKPTQKKLVKYQSELKFSNKKTINSLTKRAPNKISLNANPIPILVKGRCMSKGFH